MVKHERHGKHNCHIARILGNRLVLFLIANAVQVDSVLSAMTRTLLSMPIIDSLLVTKLQGGTVQGW